jgi:hypothetical protein
MSFDTGTPSRPQSQVADLIHRFTEIDRRLDGVIREKRSVPTTNLRNGEIKRMARDEFCPEKKYRPDDKSWPIFPDTAEGRRYLPAIKGVMTERGFARFVRTCCPWLSEAERDAIEPVTGKIRVGRLLKLTMETRKRLGIRTIWPHNVPRSQMTALAKQQAAERQKARRAKRKAAKTTTKTDRAMDLLQDLLRYRPAEVSLILQSAVRAGIEREGATKPGKPLRYAAKRLGVVTTKTGLNGGWSWSLKCAETPCFSEGVQNPSRIDKNPLFYRRRPKPSRISLLERDTVTSTPSPAASSAGLSNGGSVNITVPTGHLSARGLLPSSIVVDASPNPPFNSLSTEAEQQGLVDQAATPSSIVDTTRAVAVDDEIQSSRMDRVSGREIKKIRDEREARIWHQIRRDNFLKERREVAKMRRHNGQKLSAVDEVTLERMAREEAERDAKRLARYRRVERRREL